MSVNQIKSLAMIGTRRGVSWKDARPQSPKAKDDFSGIILSRVTSSSTVAIQDFNYDLLSNVFICNDMAWTCINLVSSTAALGKLKVRTKSVNGGAFHYQPDHPLQKVLDFPNSSMTQFDLIQAYVTHQLLYGHITMILLRQDMVKSCPKCRSNSEANCTHQLFYDNTSPILQIMPVHPENIKKEYIKALNRECFFYQPGDGLAYPIHPDNVLTDPFYNPDVHWYGVSPTFLLKRWLNLDEEMTGQLTDYFKNGAIPSMLISLKPGTNYTYEDEPATLVEKMKQSWMNQFGSKGKTSKAPAFVYGDVTAQNLQQNINDTIGKNLYYEIQGRVCATYGVPPTLYEMGLRYGAQRASAEQHEKDFYNRTISKILVRFLAKINQLVTPSYGSDIEVVWDLSEMGIAAFNATKRDERIQRHWELGLIQRNKAQMLLGYEPDDSELGNDYYRLTVMGDGNTETGNQLDNNLQPPAVLDE